LHGFIKKTEIQSKPVQIWPQLQPHTEKQPLPMPSLDPTTTRVDLRERVTRRLVEVRVRGHADAIITLLKIGEDLAASPVAE
jgi:hypothetical protein